MPLGMEVGLGPGHIVLDGDPAHPPKGHSTPIFSADVYRGQQIGPYGPKIWGYAPLAEGELGSHLTQCGQGREGEKGRQGKERLTGPADFKTCIRRLTMMTVIMYEFIALNCVHALDVNQQFMKIRAISDEKSK